jgi:hypothetical protein
MRKQVIFFGSFCACILIACVGYASFEQWYANYLPKLPIESSLLLLDRLPNDRYSSSIVRNSYKIKYASYLPAEQLAKQYNCQVIDGVANCSGSIWPNSSYELLIVDTSYTAYPRNVEQSPYRYLVSLHASSDAGFPTVIFAELAWPPDVTYLMLSLFS